MAERPQLADYTAQLNTTFTAQTAHGPVELKLVAARELDRAGRPDDLPTPMSLVFTTEADIILQQDTYRLEHPELGSQQLFIVPVVSGKPKPDYQVIIN